MCAFERYLPVLTDEEQSRLARGILPTASELKDWAARLEEHDNRLDEVFGRAYEKQKQKQWSRKKTKQ